MTGNDIIEEVLRLLLSGQREEMNKLETSVSANATELTFAHALGAIRPGSLIDIDLETYRVWEINDQNNTVTVQPAMNGTTSAAHTAGTLAYVNPRFSRAAIFKALNDELRALSAPSNGLYAFATTEFDYEGARTTYELPSTAMHVVEVRTSLPGPEGRWTRLDDWRFEPFADTDDFASGNALFIPVGIPGRAVRVVYARPFVPLTLPTQDLFTHAGMAAEMQDIPPLGILLRLGPVREIKRNFTESQGDARRADEVPAGAIAQSYTQLRRERDQRIATEAMRLQTKFRQR